MVGVAHALPTPYADLAVIFGLSFAAEGIVANVLGNNGYRAGLVVAPALLAVGVLGAANVFAGLTRNPTLDGLVWIQATTACAAYCFVQYFVVRTERRVREYTDHVPLWRRWGDRLAERFHMHTQDNDALKVVHELDATSHRFAGLSAMAFLAGILVIHFVLSDAVPMSAAVASFIPVIGPILAGGTLLALRRTVSVGIVTEIRGALDKLVRRAMSKADPPAGLTDRQLVEAI